MSLPKIVVLLGPTASGKSSLGIELAQKLNGEIISADSRQVYRGLDIGTAKITAEEQALVPHHLLDVVDPRETYTVAQFKEVAQRAIVDILERGKRVFLVGGSPHYIQVILDNYDLPQVAPQPELRAELEALSLEELQERLRRYDPQSLSSIDLKNPRRLIRALEVSLVTGKPFSEQRQKREALYDVLVLGIEWPREELYRRIDERVDERMALGMVEEVRRLLEAGVSAERLDALGLEYRFVSRWLGGGFANEGEMLQKLKYAIHDFTRRQLTWFRREKRIQWLAGGPEVSERALGLARNFLAGETN